MPNVNVSLLSAQARRLPLQDVKQRSKSTQTGICIPPWAAITNFRYKPIIGEVGGFCTASGISDDDGGAAGSRHGKAMAISHRAKDLPCRRTSIEDRRSRETTVQVTEDGRLRATTEAMLAPMEEGLKQGAAEKKPATMSWLDKRPSDAVPHLPASSSGAAGLAAASAEESPTKRLKLQLLKSSRPKCRRPTCWLCEHSNPEIVEGFCCYKCMHLTLDKSPSDHMKKRRHHQVCEGVEYDADAPARLSL